MIRIPAGSVDLLAAQRLDDDEAESGQGDDDDEQNRRRHDEVGPRSQFGAGDLGQRFAAAPHRRGQHEHVLHRPGQADADHQP